MNTGYIFTHDTVIHGSTSEHSLSIILPKITEFL